MFRWPLSQVLLVLKEMEEVGCDLLVDVHGDEELPFVFVAGNQVRPSLLEQLKKTICGLGGRLPASTCQTFGSRSGPAHACRAAGLAAAPKTWPILHWRPCPSITHHLPSSSKHSGTGCTSARTQPNCHHLQHAPTCPLPPAGHPSMGPPPGGPARCLLPGLQGRIARLPGGPLG